MVVKKQKQNLLETLQESQVVAKVPMIRVQISTDELQRILSNLQYDIKEPISVPTDPIATSKKSGGFALWFKEKRA